MPKRVVKKIPIHTMTIFWTGIFENQAAALKLSTGVKLYLKEIL
jgi:hypothetical protein